MSIPAWQVMSWPSVTATLSDFQASIKSLQHRGTSIHFESENTCNYGQVLWSTEMSSGIIGLAWDWREVRRDVIAMADPMMVLTNLKLAERDGRPLSESDQIIHLNEAIYGLKWQDALRSERKRYHHASQARFGVGPSRQRYTTPQLMAA